MIHFCPMRIVLLRSHVPKFHVSLLSHQRRCKSITAAIERGKQSDTFAGPHRDDRGWGYRPDRTEDMPSYKKLKLPDRESRARREFGSLKMRPRYTNDRWDKEIQKAKRKMRKDSKQGKKAREKDASMYFGGSKGSKPWQEFRESRDSWPPRDFNSRDLKLSREFGSLEESLPQRDFSGLMESRAREEFNRSSDSRPPRGFGGSRDKTPGYTHVHFDKPSGRDSKESRPPRDDAESRHSRSPKYYNESQDSRPFNDFKSSRESRPPHDQREWNPSSHLLKTDRSDFNLSSTDVGNARSDDFSLESLPYSTAASEFLYGYSTVLAAIKANRRKLYTLYIHARGMNHENIDLLLARARSLKLNVRQTDDKHLRAMDKASSGRPHNGLILETSPLPQLPVTEMGPSSIEGHFSVALDHQSAEDKIVNGTQTKYTYKSAGWRYPLLLYVDGVLDEGNLGAIARSAYFLGVDAIATPTRQIAPWSHIAVKASAGAAEAIPIFSVNQPADFLGKSAREGWRIYASDAVPAEETRATLTTATPPTPEVVPPSSNVVYTVARSTKRMPHDHSPVASHPTILMMGGEGTGLRASLLNQAHYKVGIRNGRETDEVGVDSLNVSVAASLLCYEMMQKPIGEKKGDLLF